MGWMTMESAMSFADDLQRLWRAVSSPSVEAACGAIEHSGLAAAREVRAAGNGMTWVPKGGLRAVHDELCFKVGLAIRATAPSLPLKGVGHAELPEAEASLRIGSSRSPGLLSEPAFGGAPLSEMARKLLGEIAQLQRVVWQACCVIQWEQQRYVGSAADQLFLSSAAVIMPAMRGHYLTMLSDARLAIADALAAGDEGLVLRVPGNRQGVDIAPVDAGIDAEDGCAAAVRVTSAGVVNLLRPTLAVAA